MTLQARRCRTLWLMTGGPLQRIVMSFWITRVSAESVSEDRLGLSEIVLCRDPRGGSESTRVFVMKK